jgi:hypothetical protein
MKITSVSYRTNRASATNKFVHEHVELHAELGPKDKPEDAIEELRVKARELLFPELVGLGERLRDASPKVAKVIGGLDERAVADLYAQHRETFEAFLEGRVAPGAFLDRIGLVTRPVL